jgi:hypothetical protein
MRVAAAARCRKAPAAVGIARSGPARAPLLAVAHCASARVTAAAADYGQLWLAFADKVSGVGWAPGGLTSQCNIVVRMEVHSPDTCTPPLAGEWDGVSVTYTPEGTAQQLPEHYVPEAYR